MGRPIMPLLHHEERTMAEQMHDSGLKYEDLTEGDGDSAVEKGARVEYS